MDYVQGLCSYIVIFVRMVVGKGPRSMLLELLWNQCIGTKCSVTFESLQVLVESIRLFAVP